MDSGRTTIAPARYGKRSDREADRGCGSPAWSAVRSAWRWSAGWASATSPRARP
ncbi:hypothetical protein ACFQ0T_16210 [Kitasatospora gansuensis]